MSAAAASREQRDASDEGFDDAPPGVEGKRGPFLFEVTAGEGVRQLGRAEGSELLVEQVELPIQAVVILFALNPGLVSLSQIAR